MEHIDEKMTRLEMYHRVINDIATALGYRMGDTFEPEALVKQVEKLAALKPVGDALVSYFNGETSEDNLYTVFCGWRSAISDVIPVYAELAKENYTAMATLAALQEPEPEYTPNGCQAERDLVVARNTIKRLSGERDAALRILAALREPSDTMLNTMSVAAEKANTWVNTAPVTSQELQNRLWIAGMNAAITVAEQEVNDGLSG